MNEEDAKYCMIDGIPREIILKELGTYKKALYMACDDLRREKCMGCGDTIVCEECDQYRDYFIRYLQKAREEE